MSQERVLFNRLTEDMDIEEARVDPLRKRIRKQILDFCARNYLRIIKFLTAIIIVLIFCFVGALVCRITTCGTASHHTTQPTSTEQAQQPTILSNISIEPTQITIYVTPKIEVTTRPINDDGCVELDEDDCIIRKITCKKIKCTEFDPPCNISRIDYVTTKVYSYCHCLPMKYQLVRYQQSLKTGDIY